MTFYVIHAGAAATLASDDAVVPAADIAILRSANEVLLRADAIGDAVATSAEAVRLKAEATGTAAGLTAGRDAALAEAQAHLLDLTARAAADRAIARSDVSRLALEVVRRIASEVGSVEMVAALAERAAADLLPETVATVRVPIAAVAATSARLIGYAGLTVVADAELSDNDCIVDTLLGVSHAGLDIQLAAVEKAWSLADAG